MSRHDDEMVTHEADQAEIEALSALISGIADELNSPLGALCASADTLRRAAGRIEAPSETAEAKERAAKGIARSARTVVEASRRLEKILRALQDFTKLNRAGGSVADVRERIENASLFVQHRLNNSIRLEAQLATSSAGARQ